MRGFLGGVSFGALVAAVGAVAWSLSVPLPQSVEVSVAEPARAPVTDPADSSPVEDVGADPDLVETPPAALDPQVVGDDLTALSEAETAGAARPQVGTTAGSVGDAPGGVGAPAIDIARDAPVTPVDALPAPDAPGQEQDLVVSTEPAQPPAPTSPAQDQNPLGETTAEPRPESPGETVTDPSTSPASSDGTQGATALPAPDVASSTPGLAAPDLGGPSLGSAPDPTATPLLPGQGQPAPEQVGTQTPEVAAQESDDSGAQPSRIAVLPTTTNTGEAVETTRPRIGTPAGSLVDRDRTDEGTEPASVAPRGLDPFVANAEAFTPEEGRALMSIVLIDDADAIGAEALQDFPYPLTFALDPNDPRAVEKMRAHRAAGFEVMVMADLARDASPQDAETALAVWLDQLPSSVAVLEGVQTGFQGNRPLADQMAAALDAMGYGMVTQDAGLNTVQKLALRNGMPAGVVFRDFDGAGQDPRAIRRFLDQAAFRAGQEGAVIMLGRVQPDTISALLLWGLQDRASRVSLAPVSASLRAKLPTE